MAIVPDGSGKARRQLLRAVAVTLLGLLLGVTVAVSAFADRSGVQGDDFLLIWAGLAVTLSTTSASVFELGLRRSRDVGKVRPVNWGPIRAAAVLSVGAVALMAVATLILDLPGVSWRGLVLTVWAVAGSTTVVAALLGIRSAVSAVPVGSDLGRRADDYLRLRELHQGLLPPLGVLVALSTFALGAARQLSPVAGAAPVTPGVVLTFGAVGTALVGCVYAVPRHALRAEGHALLRRLAPVVGTDADTVRTDLGRRQETEAQLGLNTTLLGDLQAGIIILGPLLAAATALLLTPR